MGLARASGYCRAARRARGIAVAAVSPTAAAVASVANWSQYRSGPARLGLNAQESVLSPSTVSGLRQAWVTTTGDLVSEPAVVDGVVYVGSADRKVYALNATTGATLWTATTGGPVRSSPAVVDGVVYAQLGTGLGGADLRALDADTGAMVWTVPGGPLSSPSSVFPVVANGVLYSGTVAGVLVARNPATGAVLWSDGTAGGYNRSYYASLVVANGAVYAGRGVAVSAHRLQSPRRTRLDGPARRPALGLAR